MISRLVQLSVALLIVFVYVVILTHGVQVFDSL
jgi:hypothetical protein